jgi:UDP-4-amino-4-deoxy-L-arabinose formyltransferase/UDP-glucuronic acid dehydrogenase (UDP-4-keto-hexauronic acid decarboxylating)
LSEKHKSKIEISGVDLELENLASENDIKIYNPSSYSLDNEDDLNFFKQSRFDLGFCLGWQRLIPGLVLDQIEKGIFGWHGSGFKFPHGRGRSPINWSIRLGCDKIYHNCFKYSFNADDGQIFDTQTIEINDEDYVADIQAKALDHIKSSSIAIIGAVTSKTLTLRSQHNGAFLELPKLAEEDGFLQSKIMDVDQALNIVRSCSTPFPGAFLMHNGKKVLRIWRMSRNKSKETVEAGNLVQRSSEQLELGFIDGSVVINDFEILENDLSEMLHTFIEVQ